MSNLLANFPREHRAPLVKQIAYKAVDVLNEALAASPWAVTQMIENRYSADELIEHPEISLFQTSFGFDLGMLGLIVGVVRRQTGFTIAAVYDDESITPAVPVGFAILEDQIK